MWARPAWDFEFLSTRTGESGRYQRLPRGRRVDGVAGRSDRSSIHARRTTKERRWITHGREGAAGDAPGWNSRLLAGSGCPARADAVAGARTLTPPPTPNQVSLLKLLGAVEAASSGTGRRVRHLRLARATVGGCARHSTCGRDVPEHRVAAPQLVGARWPSHGHRDEHGRAAVDRVWVPARAAQELRLDWASGWVAAKPPGRVPPAPTKPRPVV